MFATETMDADFEESGPEDVIRFLKQQAEKAASNDEAAVSSKMSVEYNAALEELKPFCGFKATWPAFTPVFFIVPL